MTESPNFEMFDRIAHSFDKSDSDVIHVVTKHLFTLDACVVSWPTCTKNLERFLTQG